MSDNKNEAEKKFYPKRFVDRKDCHAIIKAATAFSYRKHKRVPNLTVYFFILIMVALVGVLLSFAATMLALHQQHILDNGLLYLVQYMFLSFVAICCYSALLVKGLKNTLNASEFLTLSMSRSMEKRHDSYCLLNKSGKIFYYNESFAKKYMSSNEVEHKNYSELLDKNLFEQKSIDAIKNSIENDVENKFSLSKNAATMEIFPLSRPDGIFTLSVVNG